MNNLDFFKNNLNEEQLEVVQSIDGPLLVLAGAGSGKTHTLIYRIINLIQSGVRPEAILLLTFTNKAAEEMLDRVEKVIGPEARAKITGSTYHSFCTSILRKYGSYIGLSKDFSIVTPQNIQSFIETAVTDIKSRKKKSGEQIELGKVRDIMSFISFYKNKETTIEDAVALTLSTVERDKNAKYYREIYNSYEDFKRKNNIVDFDDLLVLTNKLLQNNEGIRRRLSDRYEHILVDEYQDSNGLQLRFLQLLRSFENKNICVVGDDAQCIYGFRGSDFNNILNFKKDFDGAKIIKLVRNYRSSDEIVKSCNEIVKNANVGYKKELISVRGKLGKNIRTVKPENPYSEARIISKEIYDKISDREDPNEFAVIARAGFDLDFLEQNLKSMGIPVKRFGGMSFFDRRNILFYIALLDYINNPKDMLSLLRIVQEFPYIGPKTALDIIDAVSNNGEEYAAKKYRKRKFGNNLGAFFDRIFAYRASNYVGLPKKILSFMEYIVKLRISESNASLSSKEEDTDILKNDIERLNPFIERESEFDNLIDFATSLSLGRDDKKDKDITDFVTLSTVHSVKGLEFKYVYIVNAILGRFPSMPKYVGDDPIIKKATKDDLEEERRVFYVAASRAKDFLMISSPKETSYHSPCDPSPYIAEMLSAHG